MHSIGPYTFTETDAQRTVGNLDAVWALLTEGRDAAVLAPLYPALSGDLATDLELVWAAWAAAGNAAKTPAPIIADRPTVTASPVPSRRASSLEPRSLMTSTLGHVRRRVPDQQV